jgi:hypothetical protein
MFGFSASQLFEIIDPGERAVPQVDLTMKK